MAMSLLLAMNVHFQSAELVMSMNEKMETSHAPSARRESPRVDGDDDDEDDDDLENEFLYSQGKNKARSQWQGDDTDLSASSRREARQPIRLLTNGQPVSGEIPPSMLDTQSVRSTSGSLGPVDRVHSLPYVDPQQPVPVRIVDPSKDLNSYGLGNVDWKKRVEGWELKQDKNMGNWPNDTVKGKEILKELDQMEKNYKWLMMLANL